jgi:hypothetical protein
MVEELGQRFEASAFQPLPFLQDSVAKVVGKQLTMITIESLG